jgi:hypothetical protein
VNDCFSVFIDDPSDLKASGRNGREYWRKQPFIRRCRTETAIFVVSGKKMNT